MSESENDVGYKRPPVTAQFKKGSSGNPKGRPKGARNFKTDLRETLARPVQVTEAGRSRSISTQQAGLERLREKALRGDDRALDKLLQLAERHAEEETAAAAEGKIADHEIEILADYTARIRESLEAKRAAAQPTATETSEQNLQGSDE